MFIFCFEAKRMTADNEIDTKEAFQRAQKGHNNKAKLVASLKSRYNKVAGALRPYESQFVFCCLMCLFNVSCV